MCRKRNVLGVDGKQVGMEMTECQMAVSSIGVMQRLERSVDRRLWAGTAAQAVCVCVCALKGKWFELLTRNSVHGQDLGMHRHKVKRSKVEVTRLSNSFPVWLCKSIHLFKFIVFFKFASSNFLHAHVTIPTPRVCQRFSAIRLVQPFLHNSPVCAQHTHRLRYVRDV